VRIVYVFTDLVGNFYWWYWPSWRPCEIKNRFWL